MNTADPHPSSHPLVSIMMPAYNAERYIAAAIESILAQTYPHWELLVVDDGSTDRTAQEAARFQDPRIRLLQQPNQGEAVARNTALAHSRGEYVAFLDSDDLFLPNHLELTVAFLQQHPERDAVYTDGQYMDPQGQLGEPLSSRRRGPFEGSLFEPLVRASDVFGPPICTVLRREAIEARTLRFDREIVIGPDWDFFTRFAETTSFGYLPEITCRYRLHAASISVATGQPRRRASLARCREKAIQLAGFAACSLETRTYAFYDLLVELLTGFPDRQAAVMDWPQFHRLPKGQQARLLRLMAGRALLETNDEPLARRRYHQALALDPINPRNLLPSLLFALSPAVWRRLLRARQTTPDPR